MKAFKNAKVNELYVYLKGTDKRQMANAMTALRVALLAIDFN